MVGVLIFATWGKPEQPVGFWNAIYGVKWWLTGLFAIVARRAADKMVPCEGFKVVLAAAAVLALAFVFPHQPLIAFSAGIIAVVLLPPPRGNRILVSVHLGFCQADHCRCCSVGCWLRVFCWDGRARKA